MKSIKLALIMTVVFGLVAGSAFALPTHEIVKVSESLGLTSAHNYYPEIAGDYLVWSGPNVYEYQRSTGTLIHTYGNAAGKGNCSVNEDGDVVNVYSTGFSCRPRWNGVNLTSTRAYNYMGLDQDGDIASFAAIANGIYAIHYTVNGGTPVVINPDKYYSGTYNSWSDTDSSSVVWYGWGVGAPHADTWVYHYDIATGTKTDVGAGLSFGDSEYYNAGPKVDGDYITWHNGADTHSMDIMLYEISTGTTTKIWDYGVEGTTADNPKISGNYIVWDNDESDYADTHNIWLYDIENGTTTQLSTAGYGSGYSHRPSIDGDFVAWSAYEEDGTSDVYVYQISTDTRMLVTDASWTEVNNGVWNTGPAQVYDVGGDYVLAFGYYDEDSGTYQIALSQAQAIPEPATLCLLGVALAATAGIIRKRLR